jgi:integrase
VIESFLAWSRPRLSADTMRNYDWYGESFAERWGYLAASSLAPYHVTTWVSEKGWSGTTEYNARRSIFRVFSWASDEKLLGTNPLRGMKRSKPLPRGRAMNDAEYRTLLRNEKYIGFRQFLFALRNTGCRPKEARDLTWENVRDDRWVLPKHKTVHKTKKPGVIYLNTAMRKLMTVLRRSANGPYVFVNCHGKPWTMNAVRLRITRIKGVTDLRKDVCAYLLRHQFGTESIVNGVDVATVAELMGHSSLEMISSVYLHLAEQHGHLQGAVEQATARPASARPPSTAPASTA